MDLLRQPFILLFAPQTGFDQIGFHFRNSVFFPILIDFFFCPIRQVIVRSRVWRQPVHHRFDQRRTFAADGTFPRFFHDPIHFEGIVAIYANSRKTVALSPVANAPAQLLLHRNGNGVLVIFAHENHRQFLNPGEVQAFMKIALVAGAFAKCNEGNDVLLLHFRGQSHAHRMGYLGGYRTRAGHNTQPFAAEMPRHLPAAAVGVVRFSERREHQFRQRHTSRQHKSVVAVVRQEVIALTV
ncbi:hypothetical protein D3C74_289250 [compost metagenome]